MSLFGNPPSTSKPSLFPSLNTNTNTTNASQPQQASSLFGNLNSSQPQSSAQSGSSLFGSTQPQQQSQGNSLFGQPQQQQNQSSSLFGQPQPQLQQNQGSGLFNQPQSQPQQNQSGGLFGSSQNQSGGGGLFGSTQNQGSGLFGSSQQQQPPQQQQQKPSLFSSFGGASQSQQQPLGGASQSVAPQNQSLRLGSAPIWKPASGAREKSIPEQMQTLFEKWHPDAAACLFKTYFYNNVGQQNVPYFGPGPDEDEQKWEDALSKRPNEDTIPVLCKGFAALGNRLKVQVEAVQMLQQRLHEINSSIEAILQDHDLSVSVRAADARRKHVALSQRCLALATKVQVTRNKGYSMDKPEEDLQKKLTELEKAAFDPLLGGRQEEIWARMVGIRERTRYLQEETEKLKAGAPSSDDNGLDDGVVRKAKKILTDYESQISHLQRELVEIRKDYEDWQSTSSGQRNGAR
ncbi:MAG: hypothetical protein M1828_003117 [Chrysothrix sp. TS-e1954]|nr:MAG: hypothetical protein M1828_003117 [Chrysothrix sp. TS-e1954]